MSLVIGDSDIFGWPFYFHGILHQNTVVNNGYLGRHQQYSIVVEPWAGKKDIICIPLTGRAHGIDKGRLLFINTCGLSVGVGPVVIGIQNLHLVFSHQEETAVTPSLAFSFYYTWGPPFQMNLYIAKGFFGFYSAGPGHDGKHPV